MGAEAYRKRWEETLSSFQGPIGYEIADLSITTGDDVAFGYSLNRLSGTMTTGQKTVLWVRWTACWRSINGKWLIVHTQVSVPVDLEHGKAVLDGKPWPFHDGERFFQEILSQCSTLRAISHV